MTDSVQDFLPRLIVLKDGRKERALLVAGTLIDFIEELTESQRTGEITEAEAKELLIEWMASAKKSGKVSIVALNKIGKDKDNG